MLDIKIFGFFFFKQKTAYEMRISDWSSDVCSSDLTYFLFPRSDFRIDDDWFVSGMSGTGSKSAIVDNAFVPTYRTLPLGTLMPPEPPGGAVNPGYIYKYTFRPFSGATLLDPLIAGAEAVVAPYRDVLKERTAGPSRDDVHTQWRIAESDAAVGGAP